MEEKNIIQEIILSLIKKDISINKNKLRIIKYLISNEGKEISISKLSKDLDIDYKNMWRYVQSFKEANIINLNPSQPSQGKEVKVDLNNKYKTSIQKTELTINGDYRKIEQVLNEARKENYDFTKTKYAVILLNIKERDSGIGQGLKLVQGYITPILNFMFNILPLTTLYKVGVAPTRTRFETFKILLTQQELELDVPVTYTKIIEGMKKELMAQTTS